MHGLHTQGGKRCKTDYGRPRDTNGLRGGGGGGGPSGKRRGLSNENIARSRASHIGRRRVKL